ncbi:MAG: YjbQ family protein [Nitrospirales bacterium]|nr:YjbQ family protein [Nitrospirales bacterium]
MVDGVRSWHWVTVAPWSGQFVAWFSANVPNRAILYGIDGRRDHGSCATDSIGRRDQGLVLVNAMHITASVYINDNEPGLLGDYDEFLEKMAPQGAAYRHNETGEDNGDAHIKRQFMGREVVVAITKGQLDFGPWEQIFYGEFDGRRRKRVLVKVIGE